jgi:uncharacterized Fe-S cluster-containing radical SAM superfamily enzyme
MAQLEFQDLSFQEEETKVKVNFLNLFYFYIDKKLLNKISDFDVNTNSINFENINEESVRRKFHMLLEKGFQNLTNRISNKKTIYIHKNSQIPLIGTNYFGLVDRGTNLIEIKPITSCNLGCIYCSVDEGPKSRRKVDFVVEKDYIVEEFKKIVEFKGVDNIDAHINAQGEPFLYADLIPLVKDIDSIKQVKVISIDTNGTFLNKEMVDKLAVAGLTRINLSLNALDQKIADKMAGFPYNLKKVMEIAAYIPKTKIDLLIAPVWLPGYNDNELVKLAKFANKVGAGKKCPGIGIQSFLPYKFGRNPVKPLSLDVFYKRLKEMENKHNIKLIYDKEDFEVVDVKGLVKPFKKGQIIEAEIAFPGRLKNEMISKASNRLISIPNCFKEKGLVKIKIKRSKHNIFLGEIV